MIVGIIGSGAMGSGIAQVAAMAGCEVRIFDQNQKATEIAFTNIRHSLQILCNKGKLSHEDNIAVIGRLYFVQNIETLAGCDLVIEAIVEDLSSKQTLFSQVELVVSEDCVIATNTSSLSVTSIASVLKQPERCIGMHFFNPPVIMKLVEVVPALQTSTETIDLAKNWISSWGKMVVITKDSPGFIVNKVARPFYGEAIRIFEEGGTTIEKIDLAMTAQGFRMGPFALMDFIGHDVNFKATESVWKSFYYDGRYRPSITQQRMVEAGHLGRKTGKGFYDYTQESISMVSQRTDILNDIMSAEDIFFRIMSLLVNEACDTVDRQICSATDVETAVLYGVNYPKGLLAWGNELGYQQLVNILDDLYHTHHDERYRVSRYLRNLA